MAAAACSLARMPGAAARRPGYSVLALDELVTKLIGDLDPLVPTRRRHANVGQDDVGLLRLDRSAERLQILAGGDDQGRDEC